jgi:hypothetical protein
MKALYSLYELYLYIPLVQLILSTRQEAQDKKSPPFSERANWTELDPAQCTCVFSALLGVSESQQLQCPWLPSLVCHETSRIQV